MESEKNISIRDLIFVAVVFTFLGGSLMYLFFNLGYSDSFRFCPLFKNYDDEVPVIEEEPELVEEDGGTNGQDPNNGLHEEQIVLEFDSFSFSGKQYVSIFLPEGAVVGSIIVDGSGNPYLPIDIEGEVLKFAPPSAHPLPGNFEDYEELKGSNGFNSLYRVNIDFSGRRNYYTNNLELDQDECSKWVVPSFAQPGFQFIAPCGQKPPTLSKVEGDVIWGDLQVTYEGDNHLLMDRIVKTISFYQQQQRSVTP